MPPFGLTLVRRHFCGLLLLAALLTDHPALGAGENLQPLWNGRDLDGWHIIGQGTWKIEEGVLHALHVNTDPQHGHLVTDREFTDFTVRLKFKAVRGNSGLYFRIDEVGGRVGVAGLQAEIDAVKDVGGLYETGGRKWVVQPAPADVQTWFKPGAWNEMTVSARGGHIVVHVNGRKTAEVTGDPGRAKGRIALQLHGGSNVEVWFKDLAIITD